MPWLNRKNILIAAGLLDCFIFGFLTSFVILNYFKAFQKTNPKVAVSNSPTPVPISQAEPSIAPTEVKGVFNVVLLGYGGAGHAGSLLTDSIVVVHIDTNTKKALMISVPRDLWIPGNRKINAEASVNGFGNVGNAVQNVVGLYINHYVSVDFGGFTKIIDNLGGITVDVPKSFDDPLYPIAGQENNTCGFTLDQINTLKTKYSDFNLEKQFTCRYEQLHFTKGPTNLDGTIALKFVRSRHGDNDFGRSERQFAVLKGILAKLVSLKALSTSGSTIDTLLKIVKTNLTPGEIKAFIQVIGDTGVYKVNQIQLTPDNSLDASTTGGQYILVPKSGGFNFSSVQNYVRGNLN